MDVKTEMLRSLAGQGTENDRGVELLTAMNSTSTVMDRPYSQELSNSLVELHLALWRYIYKLGIEDKVKARINARVEELMR